MRDYNSLTDKHLLNQLMVASLYEASKILEANNIRWPMDFNHNKSQYAIELDRDLTNRFDRLRNCTVNVA